MPVNDESNDLLLKDFTPDQRKYIVQELYPVLKQSLLHVSLYFIFKCDPSISMIVHEQIDGELKLQNASCNPGASKVKQFQSLRDFVLP